MSKKSWYETINERLPKEIRHNYHSAFWPGLDKNLQSLFNDFKRVNEGFEVDKYNNRPGAMKINDLMADLEGIGFRDKGEYYEMATGLGGNSDVKEDAVKVELLHSGEGDFNAYVKVTYEHKMKTEHSYYSHSQTTSATLPEDANEETISAHFDDDNMVVVTVDKKAKPKKNTRRTIPIQGA